MRKHVNVASNVNASTAELEAKLAALEAKLAESEATALAALEAAAESEAKVLAAHEAQADAEVKLEAALAAQPVSTGGKLSKKLFVKALLSTKACTIAEVTSALVTEYGNGGDVASQSLINDLRYIDKTPVGRAPNNSGRGFRFYIPNTDADEVYMLKAALAAKQADADAEVTPTGNTSTDAENTSASE